MRDYTEQLEAVVPYGVEGRVVRTQGMVIAVSGMPAPVGAQVVIDRLGGGPLRGEIIGFHEDETLVYPYEEVHGLRMGATATLAKSSRYLPVGTALIGRVLDAHGTAIDGKPQPKLVDRAPLSCAPPLAVERPRIDLPLSTGIRAIDSLLTCGLGQRMGIFAGAGVGKSVLLGMMSRYTSADVNVIALIGERGREVNDFLERDLGPEGLARSVVVIATGDQPALLRVQAALTATAIAEHFRNAGKQVLLLMDSLTRFAMAQREIGLAAGEPPTTRGYPPSVFSLLPRLVERAGQSAQGSITAYYSVLVEGDDPNEPIADTVRGLLDGHTYLSRKLASKGHFPAIDVLNSISRVMTDISDPQHLQAAQKVRSLIADYQDNEDLITIGAYRQGSNPAVDSAIRAKPLIDAFLKQNIDEASELRLSCKQLMELAAAFAVPRAGTPGQQTPATAAAKP